MLGAVAEEAIVADAHEALRQHVQQLAGDEFLRVEAHRLAAVACSIVFVAEAYFGVGVQAVLLLRAK